MNTKLTLRATLETSWTIGVSAVAVLLPSPEPTKQSRSLCGAAGCCGAADRDLWGMSSATLVSAISRGLA